MNKLFTLVSIFFITLSVNAQIALPNPGFEAWSTIGIYENPDNWSTLNASTATLGVLTALKATGADVYSGNTAIKLITKQVLSFTANGIATTGSINTSTQTISGGIPYTGRPDSISGWYKYVSVGGDNGFVAFTLLDAQEDTIGFANFTTPAANVGSYTYFKVAVNYFSSGTPTLSRCLLSSSAGFTAVVNSTLFIDDLALISNSTGITEELPTNANSVKYYAASGIISIYSPFANVKKAKIVDITGKESIIYSVSGINTELKPENLAPGVYMILLYDESSKVVSTKKIMVQ